MASRIATPMFVVDATGTLVFYNEAAEQVLGMTFADIGEVPPEEWSAFFSPKDVEGRELPLRELPLGVALFEGRPNHSDLLIRSGDGSDRRIAVTAVPLLAHPDEVVGGVAMFWDRDSAREELR